MTCKHGVAGAHPMRLAAIGLVVMVISACAKPYDPPALEQSRYGLPLESGAESFGGLKQLSATGVRVLWIHGMCSHDERWINNRVDVISRAMSIAPYIVPQESDENSEGLITTYKFGNMTVDFLLWSSLTENIKKNLKFDDSASSGSPTGRFPYRRASVNEQIKAQLLNDCLADVAIYLGPNGDGIRKAARQALCLTFGGTYDQTGNSKSNWCKNLQNTDVVFVTESLGSQIVYRELASLMEYKAEAVESLKLQSQQNQTQNQEELSSTYMDGFMLSKVFTTTHFLVSNQVPLLQLGEGRNNSIQNLIKLRLNFLQTFQSLSQGPKANNLLAPRVQSLFRNQLSQLHERETTFVSFSDPNDLLSYRLLPMHLPSHANFNNIRLINVIVSNAHTYLGLLEWPPDAHCGYATNPYVAGLIVHGYTSDEPIPQLVVASGAGSGSCLVE